MNYEYLVPQFLPKKDYSNEQTRKDGFIKYFFKPCICCACADIENISYKCIRHGNGYTEYAIIDYASGFTKKVNITDDSSLAIMQDVLKNIIL